MPYANNKIMNNFTKLETINNFPLCVGMEPLVDWKWREEN